MDFLNRAKGIPAVKYAYKFPILVKTYHFILAVLGACVYGFPSRKIYMIGVTGTKGKTTTLELLNSILESAGEKTAMISSVRIKIGSESKTNDTENTMPGRFFIQRFLRRAVGARCTVALIEVTSQGVALSHHRYMEWDIGVITNIAPEHTEAHGSFEEYRNAKLKFLSYVLKKQGTVFINESDANSRFFIDALKDRKIVVLYSRDNAHMQSLLARPSIMRKSTEFPPEFILNDFNKDNIAAAEAVARYAGISENVIEGGVRNFRGVPGRMEFLRKGDKTVVIDYAHTPESLEAVYVTLKELLTNDKKLGNSGRQSSVRSHELVCVLGSAGGGRDSWKRPMLGKIASRYCDTIILTNEDPYDEDPAQIISEIKAGIDLDKQGAAVEILDRGEAIERAISSANRGDIVVITGKGSEEWIHSPNGTKIPWSDKKAVEDALK